MPRERLDQQIHKLLDDLVILASMVETATLKAVESLKQQDFQAAREVIENDKLVNQKRFEIENDCIATIATQQPIMATDLRMMASILEVTSEIERMGDYAKGIARVTLRHGDQPLVKPLIDIPRMAELTVSMLHRAISAFISGDVEQARAIPLEDDAVDNLYNQVYRELVTYMLVDPTTIDRANYLMWAAHNLERLADRVTNICERTIYTRTGQLVELSASDDEIKDS